MEYGIGVEVASGDFDPAGLRVYGYAKGSVQCAAGVCVGIVKGCKDPGFGGAQEAVDCSVGVYVTSGQVAHRVRHNEKRAADFFAAPPTRGTRACACSRHIEWSNGSIRAADEAMLCAACVEISSRHITRRVDARSKSATEVRAVVVVDACAHARRVNRRIRAAGRAHETMLHGTGIDIVAGNHSGSTYGNGCCTLFLAIRALAGSRTWVVNGSERRSIGGTHKSAVDRGR